MKLKCENCNYQYETTKEVVPKKCPYCDKIGTLTKSKSMQDYIDETTTERL